MRYSYYPSPIGPLLLAGDLHGWQLIGLPEGKGPIEPGTDWVLDDTLFQAGKQQLAEYFSGTRTEFDLPLHPRGTPFQLEVLKALQSIPYGQTRSYRDIAVQVGRPKAVRAVGAANGRNPLPIIIPCHRVIGADGHLTGFAGGIQAKQFLLALERGNKPLPLSTVSPEITPQ